MQNIVKSMPTKGISQFELTQKLLQNLNNFKLTPTAKLVLMYLSSCYNPKHGEMFPKQRTIADKLGISEASVIRAVCELHKEGLIISERKYTNRYKYTSKFLISLGILDNKMQVDKPQNEIKQTCKMRPQLIEQKKETNNTTKVDDFKILKDYAIKHNAKNIHAYINYLKSSGSDKQIIKDYKQAKANRDYMLQAAKQVQRELQQAKENTCVVPNGWFDRIREQIQKNPAPITDTGLKKSKGVHMKKL